MNSFGWQGKDENQARTSPQDGSEDGIYRTNRGAAYSGTARIQSAVLCGRQPQVMEACQGKLPHIGVASSFKPANLSLFAFVMPRVETRVAAAVKAVLENC